MILKNCILDTVLHVGMLSKFRQMKGTGIDEVEEYKYLSITLKTGLIGD